MRGDVVRRPCYVDVPLSRICWIFGAPGTQKLRSSRRATRLAVGEPSGTYGTGLAACRGAVAPSLSYRPRHPEQGALHQIVREHYETFRAHAAERRDGQGLPRFVERAFQDFLTCGCLAAGFARFRCATCRHDQFVAFSCKGRGFCPSCGGRRMTERAAHLVDLSVPRSRGHFLKGRYDVHNGRRDKDPSAPRPASVHGCVQGRSGANGPRRGADGGRRRPRPGPDRLRAAALGRARTRGSQPGEDGPDHRRS